MASCWRTHTVSRCRQVRRRTLRTTIKRVCAQKRKRLRRRRTRLLLAHILSFSRRRFLDRTGSAILLPCYTKCKKETEWLNPSQQRQWRYEHDLLQPLGCFSYTRPWPMSKCKRTQTERFGSPLQSANRTCCTFRCICGRRWSSMASAGKPTPRSAK